MKKILTALAVIFALFTLPLAAADVPSGWTTDYEQALAQAQKENKNVLVLFTGSDWCSFCIKLHDEVLDKRNFKKFAKDNFVLVYLDFPKRKKQTAKEKRNNGALRQKFKVNGYPGTVILDKDGTELGRIVGYSPNYLQLLEKYKVSAASKKEKTDDKDAKK